MTWPGIWGPCSSPSWKKAKPLPWESSPQALQTPGGGGGQGQRKKRSAGSLGHGWEHKWRLDGLWKDQEDVKESSSKPGVEEGSWWAVPPLGPRADGRYPAAAPRAPRHGLTRRPKWSSSESSPPGPWLQPGTCTVKRRVEGWATWPGPKNLPECNSDVLCTEGILSVSTECVTHRNPFSPQNNSVG